MPLRGWLAVFIYIQTYEVNHVFARLPRQDADVSQGENFETNKRNNYATSGHSVNQRLDYESWDQADVSILNT